ncbi:MAG: HAD-IIIC family phosphatase [bacterium]|nr:HAD-IIIC family phosphatase [bacterium]
MSERRPLRIALLASFTAKPIADALDRACHNAGIPATVYLGAYQQYAQEILNPTSAFSRCACDVMILAVDTHALAGDLVFRPYRLDDDARRRWADEQAETLIALARTAAERCEAMVLLHNLEVPMYSPLGPLEHAQEFGIKEAVETINAKLRSACKGDPRIYLFDFDGFCARVGKRVVRDPKLYYLGDFKVAMAHVPELCSAYLAYLRPLRVPVKKCLVLDCDHTLWGGVVGEVGIEGIQLGPTPEGRPYWEFQQHVLALHERGVVLAINSRNNPDDVLRVLREHPYQVLREEHFAAMAINWEDKASNIRAIAEELNIGVGSVVFMDDDPLNRALVAHALPEVEVVNLPGDPAWYVNTLLAFDGFHTLQLTDEDRQKGRFYAQEQQRRHVAVAATDLASYIRQLDVAVTIGPASAMTIPRIAQLTLKTNQFNLTTRRYTETEVHRLAHDARFLMLTCAARDRFGDSGIVGVAIAERSVPDWRMDTFLVSCRVIGRKIEDALLAYVMQEAARAGARRVIGEFIPTAKNTPAQDFYRAQGFVKMEGGGANIERWERSCTGAFPFPEELTVDGGGMQSVRAI